MRILIAEDDDPKLNRIRYVLADHCPNAEIHAVGAANAALAALRERVPDIFVLDMSLPTFEIGRGEPGGRPQDFGGLEVMDHMEVEDIICPTIVVTQYEEFPRSKGENMTREEVAATARSEHPSMFIGLIYYSSVSVDWESELRSMVAGVISGGRT